MIILQRNPESILDPMLLGKARNDGSGAKYINWSSNKGKGKLVRNKIPADVSDYSYVIM